MHEVIRTVGDKVLKGLIECYYSGEKYYLSNNVNYLFGKEEEALFTSNEDIIKHVEKLLSDKYQLKVTPVERTFKFSKPENEDFTFSDIELQIILKENN